MPRSYRVDTFGMDESLDEARVATLAEAEEIAMAIEYGGDGYTRPVISESDDPPTMAAADYLAVWPEYPGRCPEGVDPEEWFYGAND